MSSTMFSNKMLYIPDYVLPDQENNIINYFEDFEIAKVKKVEFYEHPEEEYHVEGRYPYCYAIIEINHYYNNTCALNFYNKIENNNCHIIYDDPFYWELQFSPFTDKISEVVHENVVMIFNNLNSELSSVYNSENESSSEYYSGDEEDDAKDLDYNYQDDDLNNVLRSSRSRKRLISIL